MSQDSTDQLRYLRGVYSCIDLFRSWLPSMGCEFGANVPLPLGTLNALKSLAEMS